MSDELYEKGLATRRAVLGDAYVEHSLKNRTPFDADFQRYITENAWGAVWSRPHFTKRERSLVTLAILAALGRWEEVALHARAAANTGASEDDIKEVMLHVAVYAGVPAANHAMKVLKETLRQMRETPTG